MSAGLRIVDRKPSLDEYLALTGSVGWSAYVTPESAETALGNTLFAIVAESEGRAAGMGRIVGDGALFLYIQDILVIPAMQGRGLGDAIMSRLMRWLDESAPDRAFVGLFSAAGKAPFYERYGFARASPERPGMSQYLRLGDVSKAAPARGGGVPEES